MSFTKIILFFTCVFICTREAKSQVAERPLSNKRKKIIVVSEDVVRLDSLSIVPNTFYAEQVSSDHYTLDEVKATLTWKIKPIQHEITVSYRVLPINLNHVARQYNYDSIRFNFAAEPKQMLASNSTPVIDFGNFMYSGSVGRGISIGNAQDAVVNSSLNLQLNGFIGDSIQLSAAISDNNIPIQPEGNTQQLRDFDKIFMQVKKRNWQANFGDIDIRQSRNYFLNFYKRLQGASFQTDNQIGGTKNSLLVSGAIAKGKFTRNVISPSEGNQGPYRLSNPNNELYFIVLANTEKVFINGQLLIRGDDQDYVIDYNTAEVTFTPKHLITKDTRIQVEFEYADRNFLNAQLYLNDEVTVNKRLKLSVGAFSNTDAKNSPINQQLDTRQKQFLSEIGNNLDSARYPNAMPDTFSVNKVLYRKMDTVFNNLHDSIYMYTPYNKTQLYNVSFLFVGKGKGNYTRQNGNANGRVYIWISPDKNGVPQGDWEPVALLVTPKKQQLFSLGASYALSERTSIYSEVAMSNYDVNTYSSKDKNVDKGYAAKFEVNHQQQILRSIKKGLGLNSSLGYEYVQSRFKPIERIRNVEFNRDWGLPFIVSAATEQLANGLLKLSDSKDNNIKYELVKYLRDDQYNGTRQTITHNEIFGGWKLADQLIFTDFTYKHQAGKIIRPSIDLSRKLSSFHNLVIGANFTARNYKVRDNITDTLNLLSAAYTTFEMYLKTQNNKPDNWGISYFQRTNQYPSGKNLVTSDQSDNFSIYNQILSNPHHQVRLNATFRNLKVLNTTITNLKPEQSFLGRVVYDINKWRGFLNGSALYELGSGQEQKREYTFIEVPAGQGQYTWIDYNHDGIPQINEFELAVFQDQKKYIKVYTPTNIYVKANYIQFNYSIDLNPSALFIQSNFKKFIKLFNTNSTFQINRKGISNKTIDFNPFNNNVPDTALLSFSSFLANSLFINRNSPKWGIDITQRVNNNKSLLTYGFEGRKVSDLSIKLRKNITRAYTSSLKTIIAQQILITPKFTNRNYSLIQHVIQPEVSYVHKSDLRLALNYTYDSKLNRTGTERAINHALTGELKYNVFSNGTINTRFTYNNILFSGGDANTATGYEILDGLLPGNNFLWDIEIIKKLAGNLEMNIQYEGRKPGDTHIIHTGRASIRAMF